MKMIAVVALALVAAVAAAPAANQPEVTLVRSNNDADPAGPYNYGFEISDGSKISATGELKTVNNEENKPVTVVVSRGSFTFIDNETGKPINTEWYADETGFHASGDSIPQAPSVRR